MPPRPQRQRILIIRPSALGDVCRTVPVLASLRKAFPAATIDWLVQDTFAPAIEAHPYLDEVIGFPRAAFGRWWRSPRQAGAMLRWAGSLRRRSYDLVLDCQGLGRSGLFTRLTGARRRVGHQRVRECAWLGYNVRHPRPGSPHTVDHMLSLLEGEGIEPVTDMRLYLSEDDRQWWAAECAGRGIAGKKYAVIAPTARWTSKRWPIDRWRQVIPHLATRGFEPIVITGAPPEIQQTRELLSPSDQTGSDRILDMVGKATIGQTMAIIAYSSLVIANDSAPLHIAVGFDRPLVALFGPTDPAIVGPYQRNDCVIRRFEPEPGRVVSFKDPKLGDSLMRLITVEDVLAGIDREVSRRPSPDGQFQGQATNLTGRSEQVGGRCR